jgi:DNA integrity scanning protein DisA with diadenylate cyclase activity
MKTKLKFNRGYFLLTILFLAIEVLIAVFVHDTIIRPYFGDFLVVILLYCFVKSFFNTPVIATAIGVLVFSFIVEATQYFHLVNLLGLQHSKLARVVMGNYFAWMDIVTYTAGIIVVLVVEKISAKK